MLAFYDQNLQQIWEFGVNSLMYYYIYICAPNYIHIGGKAPSVQVLFAMEWVSGCRL
jgi:hypothetical protein